MATAYKFPKRLFALLSPNLFEALIIGSDEFGVHSLVLFTSRENAELFSKRIDEAKHVCELGDAVAICHFLRNIPGFPPSLLGKEITVLIDPVDNPIPPDTPFFQIDDLLNAYCGLPPI